MNRNEKPSRNDLIWIVQKGKLLNKFSSLSELDLLFEEGQKHEMIERLGGKLKKSGAEMYLIFKNLN